MGRGMRTHGRLVLSHDWQLFGWLVTQRSVNEGMELMQARGRGGADWLAAVSRARRRARPQ